MAEHKLAILVSAVGAAKAAKQLKGVDAAVARIGAAGGKGLRNLTTNLAALGAVAAVGIGVAVKSGLANLATLESAVASVDGAISQMGLTGKLTGAQIAAWSNEIESSIGAAFDDKDIIAATENIIRYGKVSEANLRPAMQVMTDLAAKTGSVESASELLGKALADPVKATGKLSRYGIILTKAQQKQIKVMTEAGDVAGAQAVLLGVLAETTKGAAAASQGPYRRAISVLADVTEDAQKALAEGFLPVIQRVAEWLSTKLADPAVIEDIRGFGKSLAGIFDKGVDFATKIPWGSVRDAMGALGSGAKMALDAFLAMPSWVQTAVVGGWGLNKLTGGALGDIAGELGKGLIKGVLGINAGVVNINAGVVRGGGAVPGGAVAGKGGIGGSVGTAAKLAVPAAVIAAGIAAGVEIVGINAPQHQTIDPNTGKSRTFRGTNVAADQIANLERSLPQLIARASGGDKDAAQKLEMVRAEIAKLQTSAATSAANSTQALGVTRNLRQTTDQVWQASLRTALAIDRKNWSPVVNVNPAPITVRVNTNVSVRDVQRRSSTISRYAGKSVPI